MQLSRERAANELKLRQARERFAELEQRLRDAELEERRLLIGAWEVQDQSSTRYVIGEKAGEFVFRSGKAEGILQPCDGWLVASLATKNGTHSGIVKLKRVDDYVIANFKDDNDEDMSPTSPTSGLMVCLARAANRTESGSEYFIGDADDNDYDDVESFDGEWRAYVPGGRTAMEVLIEKQGPGELVVTIDNHRGMLEATEPDTAGDSSCGHGWMEAHLVERDTGEAEGLLRVRRSYGALVVSFRGEGSSQWGSDLVAQRGIAPHVGADEATEETAQEFSERIIGRSGWGRLEQVLRVAAVPSSRSRAAASLDSCRHMADRVSSHIQIEYIRRRQEPSPMWTGVLQLASLHSEFVGDGASDDDHAAYTGTATLHGDLVGALYKLLEAEANRSLRLSCWQHPIEITEVELPIDAGHRRHVQEFVQHVKRMSELDDRFPPKPGDSGQWVNLEEVLEALLVIDGFVTASSDSMRTVCDTLAASPQAVEQLRKALFYQIAVPSGSNPRWLRVSALCRAMQAAIIELAQVRQYEGLLHVLDTAKRRGADWLQSGSASGFAWAVVPMRLFGPYLCRVRVTEALPLFEAIEALWSQVFPRFLCTLAHMSSVLQARLDQATQYQGWLLFALGFAFFGSYTV